MTNAAKVHYLIPPSRYSEVVVLSIILMFRDRRLVGGTMIYLVHSLVRSTIDKVDSRDLRRMLGSLASKKWTWWTRELRGRSWCSHKTAKKRRLS